MGIGVVTDWRDATMNAQRLLDALCVEITPLSPRRKKRQGFISRAGYAFHLFRESIADEPIGDLWFGIVHRPHHLFAIGDFVVAVWTNGEAARASFSGYSSKKQAFIWKPIYMSFAKWTDYWNHRQPSFQDRGAGTVLLFELPDALASKTLADPVARAETLEALVAAHAASRVGHSSPAHVHRGSRTAFRRRQADQRRWAEWRRGHAR